MTTLSIRKSARERTSPRRLPFSSRPRASRHDRPAKPNLRRAERSRRYVRRAASCRQRSVSIHCIVLTQPKAATKQAHARPMRYCTVTSCERISSQTGKHNVARSRWIRDCITCMIYMRYSPCCPRRGKSRRRLRGPGQWDYFHSCPFASACDSALAGTSVRFKPMRSHSKRSVLPPSP